MVHTWVMVRTERERTARRMGRTRARKSNHHPAVCTAAGWSCSSRRWTASHLGDRCGCPSEGAGVDPSAAGRNRSRLRQYAPCRPASGSSGRNAQPDRPDLQPFPPGIRRASQPGRPDRLNPIHRPGQAKRTQVTPDPGDRRSTAISHLNRPGTRGPGIPGHSWSVAPHTSGSSPPCR